MKHIFANWKMYLDFNESDELSKVLANFNFSNEKINLAVFPMDIAIERVINNLKNSSIKIGSQDHTWRPKGAYTGAVSALMLKDLGCSYALVGHSERRHIFGDTDDDVRKKIEEALNVGLTPIVCIGETKEERDEGKREYRLKKQLMKAFEGLNLNDSDILVAYEPIWAISKGGVGEPCTPLEADDVQGWIKLELKNYFKKDIAVLYGGSAKADNVLSYLSLDTVDGALVGNASTKAETFLPLVEAVDKM